VIDGAAPGPVRLSAPLGVGDALGLRAGDRVLLSGVLYTARDTAHRRLVEFIREGRPLPFDPQGAVIYYAGPSPERPGRPIGSAGPTTAGRMDAYAVSLLEQGVRGMIGKGARSAAVVEAIMAHGAVYLAATGGAGALLAGTVLSSEVVAFPELGPEAVRRLAVRDFPAMVVNDARGGDLYRRRETG
jgi:fumarate hydratase subunit beta